MIHFCHKCLIKGYRYRVFLLAAMVVASSSIWAQNFKAVIEGPFKNRGSLELHNVQDSSSLTIGRQSRIPYVGGQFNKNTVIGNQAGSYSTLPVRGSVYGRNNVLFGFQSGQEIIDNHSNTLAGALSGRGLTGSQNTILGNKAGQTLDDGNRNTYIGTIAGIGLATSPNSTSNNTYVGYNAGGDNLTGSNSIFIGNKAGKFADGLDNTLIINNKDRNNPLIFGDFARKSVAINYNGDDINDALHIEANSDQNAMRVRVNGGTKLRVHSNGGVSFGRNTRPHPDGLLISNLRSDTVSRVLISPSGNLKLDEGVQRKYI